MQKSKQVIVVRKDLNMRKGKIAAQAAHASNAVILDLVMEDLLWKKPHPDGWLKGGFIWASPKASVLDWITGKFTKICVSVNTKEDLYKLYDMALAAEIPCSFITDAGLTEFKGVPTETCIAIGPAWSDEIDKITDHLPLL